MVVGLISMQHGLRWFKLWRAVGWIWIVAIIYLSLTPHPIEIDIAQGDKLGHALGYLGVMLWFTQLYERRVQVLWGAGLVALGIALEYVQGWTGYRNFEYLDMVADGVGVTAGWLLGGTAMAHLLIRLERRINV
jgi:VanZ family protein